MLPAVTPRLRFRQMTPDDLPHISSLETGGIRGPAGWIEWNLRNYSEHGFGLWIVESHTGEFIGDCDNVASQGVAMKIGMVLEREVHKNGGQALVFGCDRYRGDPSTGRRVSSDILIDANVLIASRPRAPRSGRPPGDGGRHDGRVRARRRRRDAKVTEPKNRR